MSSADVRVAGTEASALRSDIDVQKGSKRRTISYQPALDGVRALAVIVVLLFHAEVPGFDGGYLGVSVFFTLSGYLITSLLAAEMDRNGKIALAPFYARRARRLVPASLMVVMLVVAARSVTDWFDAVDSLRAHAVGSLLQVANWVFLAGGGSYQDLLEQRSGTASPLEHYWSLAIEEQFYWLWPVVFIGLWRVGKTERGRIVAAGAVTLVAVIAAPLIAFGWGADAAYWSTPARIAEILLGTFAALLLRRRSIGPKWAVVAPLALVALGICVATFPTVGGPAYAGALPAVAVISVALIVGLQAPSSTRTSLSAAPMVWIGTISYGLYLFHWPIFVVVDADRLGVDGPPLLAVRLTLTVLIAQASFSLFEQPIRHGLRVTPRASLVAAAGATAAAVVIAAMVVPGPRGTYWEADADDVSAAAIVIDSEELIATPAAPIDESSATSPTMSEAIGSDIAPLESNADQLVTSITTVPMTDQSSNTATGSTGDESDVPMPSRPVRVLVAGDSTAEAMGAGVVGWAAENPMLAQAEVMAAPGCGFVRGGEYFLGDSWKDYQEGCTRYFFEALPERVNAVAADAVVLLGTSWDLLDRRWDGSETQGPSDYADRIDTDYGELTATLLRAGAGKVIWLDMPVPNQNWKAADLAADEARFGLLRTAMVEAIEAAPVQVSVIDVGAWLASMGLDTDRELRPDGIHFTPEAAQDIVDSWLGEQLLRAVVAP